MKKREVITELRATFEAPAPQEKTAFLRKLETQPISNAAFVWMQLRYMRGSILLISALGFVMLLLCGIAPKPETLWIFSALSPFLACSVLGVARRSYVCGMEELEFATRFSLKSVMLARMGCLFVLNGLALLTMILFLGSSGFWILKTGVYLLLPYCSTISISLPLTRKYHGKFVSYLCIFVSAVVSACVVYVQINAIVFSTLVIAILLVAELLVIVSESAKLIHQTEDLTWNYN